MPSFDIVSKVNSMEVENAVSQAKKELATRFDFKGTAAAIELKEKEITLTGDAEFQLQQVMDILEKKADALNPVQDRAVPAAGLPVPAV